MKNIKLLLGILTTIISINTLAGVSEEPNYRFTSKALDVAMDTKGLYRDDMNFDKVLESDMLFKVGINNLDFPSLKYSTVVMPVGEMVYNHTLPKDIKLGIHGRHSISDKSFGVGIHGGYKGLMLATDYKDIKIYDRFVHTLDAYAKYKHEFDVKDYLKVGVYREDLVQYNFKTNYSKYLDLQSNTSGRVKAGANLSVDLEKFTNIPITLNVNNDIAWNINENSTITEIGYKDEINTKVISQPKFVYGFDLGGEYKMDDVKIGLNGRITSNLDYKIRLNLGYTMSKD